MARRQLGTPHELRHSNNRKRLTHRAVGEASPLLHAVRVPSTVSPHGQMAGGEPSKYAMK